MFKFIGWCLFLIFGYIQSNAQNFQPKLFYPSSNVKTDVHKQRNLKLNKLRVHSFSLSKPHTIHLFKTMPNPYQPKKRLPVFCEIEHQISKLIKRRMKLGVP